MQKLSSESIHYLCSGQCISNLSTAVKELLENSIDSNANTIQINIKNYGLDYIEIIDNGTGISKHDFDTVCLKHCTSKIQEFDEIYSTNSFGFRGEALSSLCAISKLITIVTNANPHNSDSVDPIGSKLEYNRMGKLISCAPFARSQGTTVKVYNLFESLPVRYKEFKKHAKKEYSKCLDLIHAYAINPLGFRIICTHINSKGEITPVFQTSHSRLLTDHIACIYGNSFSKSLIPFSFSKSFNSECICNISGYISKPTLANAQSTSDKQFFYINQRPCDLPKVSKVINAVYREFSTFVKYPAFFIRLSMEKGTFDVNVTPDKRTILLQQEEGFFVFFIH
jgi:DNA mismatch repair protein PMS2